ncbi:MAG: flagellar basal body P-ring protein FlgI [Armatimonadota bacterium]
MRVLLTCAVLAALAAPLPGGSPGVRIKDIARVQSERSNQLVGYGLVVGLEGTGDSAQVAFTNQAVRNLVTRFGNRPDAGAQMKTKNVATVMLTADLPPFAKPGDRVDVVVSSLGDARSLQGGILLQAPLQGADGSVYAVAQGSVSLGGFAAAGAGAQVTKNHPTVGRIPGGALVEAPPPADAPGATSLSLSLSQPDSATAVAIARAINQRVYNSDGASVLRPAAQPTAPLKNRSSENLPVEIVAAASDSGTVVVPIPEAYRDRHTEFLALIGDLTVAVDSPARVVINERTGTVVVGGPVTISPVAVAHGSLTVEITTTAAVSQPPALSQGQTVATPQAQISASEPKAVLSPIRAATVDDLVQALNALHATPRDLIAILQAIKQAGALNAELDVL